MALLCAAGQFSGPQSAWAATPSPTEKTSPVAAKVQEGSSQSSDKKWYRSPVDFFINSNTLDIDGQAGDYSWKMEAGETKFRVKPKVKWGKAQVSAQTKVDLFKGEFSKTEQQGKWTTTQGLNGLVRFEGEYGYKTEDWGKENEEVSKHNLTAHLGVFKSWSRTVCDNTTLTLSTGAGATHNFTTGQMGLYSQSHQRIAGEDLDIFGQRVDWSAEASQRVTYDVDSGNIGANYEVFAGLEKTFPFKVFKYDGEMTLKAGGKISGNRDEPIHFSPATRVKVDF